MTEKPLCDCGCGDIKVVCPNCGYVSGYRHRHNHVCIEKVVKT